MIMWLCSLVLGECSGIGVIIQADILFFCFGVFLFIEYVWVSKDVVYFFYVIVRVVELQVKCCFQSFVDYGQDYKGNDGFYFSKSVFYSIYKELGIFF